MQIHKTSMCVKFLGLLLLYSTLLPLNSRAQAPNRSSIALASDGDLGIWLMNDDGGNSHLILPIGGNPLPSGLVWSPDGNQIAFHTELDKNIDIYVVNGDGENLRRLTEHESEDSWPTWHPSGQKIAFHTNRDGNLEIYTMTSRGDILGNLTNDPVKDHYPAWSPDARRIAFASKRGKTLGDIFLMSQNGEIMENLTNVRGEDFQPRWSWDGKEIAGTSARNGAAEIWAMDADGANARQVSDLQDPKAGGFRVREPSWSPDGKLIASASLGGGSARIRLHSAKGNLNWMDLPGIGAQDRSPAWFDPKFVVEFSVSPVEKRPLTWGWIKQVVQDD